MLELGRQHVTVSGRPARPVTWAKIMQSSRFMREKLRTRCCFSYRWTAFTKAPSRQQLDLPGENGLTLVHRRLLGTKCPQGCPKGGHNRKAELKSCTPSCGEGILENQAFDTQSGRLSRTVITSSTESRTMCVLP